MSDYIENLKTALDNRLGLTNIFRLTTDYEDDWEEYGMYLKMPEHHEVVYEDEENDIKLYANILADYYEIYGLTEKEFEEVEEWFYKESRYLRIEDLMKRVKQAVKNCDLTTEELLEELKIDKQTLDEILNNEKYPLQDGIKIIAKIISVTDYRADYILFGE